MLQTSLNWLEKAKTKSKELGYTNILYRLPIIRVLYMPTWWISYWVTVSFPFSITWHWYDIAITLPGVPDVCSAVLVLGPYIP